MPLKFENVEIVYKNGNGNNLSICKDLSLSAKEGEIIGILGPNGSGKSTIINTLINYIKIEQGEVKLPQNAKIAYIPQNFNESFFLWTSLYNNIMFLQPAFYKKRKYYKNKINKLKENFGFDFSFKIKPKECSGGMLQKVAILRAFFLSPKILLADELFSAIDINSVRQLVPIIRQNVKSNKIIAIFVMHNLEDLLNTCDKIIYISNKPFTSNKNLSEYNLIKIFDNKNIENMTTKNLMEQKLNEIFCK